MSKMMVTLVVIGLIACNSQLSSSSGVPDVTNFEELSAAIMMGSFQDVRHLTEFLKKQGVKSTLTRVSEDFMKVDPTLCAGRVGSDFELAYLRLEGTTGSKVYRYRLYWHRSEPLCIEEDFAFKNPY